MWGSRKTEQVGSNAGDNLRREQDCAEGKCEHAAARALEESEDELNKPYEGAEFDEEFCRALVEEIPALEPILQEHLKDECGELLTYIFLSQVAEWVEQNVASHEADIVRLFEALNRGLAQGAHGVPNLIVVGFMEWFRPDPTLVALLQGELRGWYEFEAGIAREHPYLRRGM